MWYPDGGRRTLDTPCAAHWLLPKRQMGLGNCEGYEVLQGRSVVELALARLVNEAALVLGPARATLPSAVLPL